MGLLKEAMNEQAAAKIGAFGIKGSGKTTTGALLALGLSKTFHNGAPVAMMDTENGSSFIKPIFDAEGVKLYVHKSRAFADMITVLHEAEGMGCCAFLMDSVSHTWKELQDAYCAKKKIKRIEFHHWRDLKGPDGWEKWTTAFLNSPLHCIVCGRAGYDYEYQENEETGKKELVKGASKMKAEGEFGYEPNLLIELETERLPDDQASKKKSIFIHRATVLKDRARALNGHIIEWPDMNAYKVGDWKPIFAAFGSHWKFLNIGGEQHAIDASRTSEDTIPQNGDGQWHHIQQRKTIASEEIEETLKALWPGQANDCKQIKAGILDALFRTRSWTAVQAKPVEWLEQAAEILRIFEAEVKRATPPPTTPEHVLALLAMVQERRKAEVDAQIQADNEAVM